MEFCGQKESQGNAKRPFKGSTNLNTQPVVQSSTTYNDVLDTTYNKPRAIRTRKDPIVTYLYDCAESGA